MIGTEMHYAELHFHLLPAIDDGPTTIEDSVALAAAAVADGTRTIVVTPHMHPTYPTDPLEVPGRAAELAHRLRRERIKLTILPGGEIAHPMVERLSDTPGLALDTLAAAGVRDPSRLAAATPHALLDHGLVARPPAVAA
jgi:hypothetical protein